MISELHSKYPLLRAQNFHLKIKGTDEVVHDE